MKSAIGALLIASAIIAINIFPDHSANQAEAYGRLTGTLLTIGFGVFLIVSDQMRKKKKAKGDQK